MHFSMWFAGLSRHRYPIVDIPYKKEVSHAGKPYRF